MTQSYRTILISVQIRTFGIQLGQAGYELVRSRVRLAQSLAQFEYREHESGPEIILQIAYATAVITLAKSALDLITTLVKLVSDRIRKGQEQSRGIELVVRFPITTLDERFSRHSIREESVPLLDDSSLTRESIEIALQQSITKLLTSTPSRERARRITRKTAPLTYSRRRGKNKTAKKKSSLNARRRRK